MSLLNFYLQTVRAGENAICALIVGQIIILLKGPVDQIAEFFFCGGRRMTVGEKEISAAVSPAMMSSLALFILLKLISESPPVNGEVPVASGLGSVRAVFPA